MLINPIQRHWRSLPISIVENPIKSPAGTARLAMMISSLTPFMVKRRKFQV